MDEKFRSRKFLVTIAIMILASAMALGGKLDAELAQIYVVIIGAYNFAQGAVDWKKS